MTPDFERRLHCLFGLTFDAVDTAAAVRVLRDAARERRPCFLSTPNLNFVVASQSDPTFRDSVLHSDLSVADGMPLLWVAKLLRIPLPERVAGSTLFERLGEGDGAPMKVFFFGAPDGVAERACARLNERASGLRCVGFDAPGFGSVESMSGDERIARINASGADFVLVSLGARKGQAWIEHNRPRLDAPILSHLGAVANFVAGTVVRAPRWMQRGGLEWLWRIKEEPGLWRRYAGDARAFAALLVTQALPYAVQVRRHRPRASELAGARVSILRGARALTLELHGAWSDANSAPLREALAEVARADGSVLVDLGDATHADSAIVALLALLRAHCQRCGRACRIQAAPAAVRDVVRACGAAYLLHDDAAPLQAAPC